VRVRIGSRGSALALAQTEDVAERLRALGHEAEVVVIRTAGDRDVSNRFSDIGAPGVFVREIEAALLDGEIDLAVHSYKDLPSRSPEGLTIAAVPERLDPADRLIVRREAIEAGGGPAGGGTKEGSEPLVVALPKGATVGTSSERRRAWLRAARPDIELLPIRGNVPTRIEKLREGPFDAIVLASAGIARLQRAAPESLSLEGLIDVRLDPATFVPAPSQGAIAVQCREQDPVEAVLSGLHDRRAAQPVRAERRLLRLVDGGCSLPFGAWCRMIGDGALELTAALELNGEVLRIERRGGDADELADEAWRLLAAGIETHRPVADERDESVERGAKP
jgi:hydroxymethylbilane synthase